MSDREADRTAADVSTDNGELPEGWAQTTVKEVSTAIQYGYTASASRDIDGPRFLRITDIQDNKVDWDDVPSCEIDETDIAKFALNRGDIVFARTGATTGKSFLIRDCPPSVFASYLIRVRPHAEVAPGFLSLFFQTPEYWQLISDNVAGNAQPNCNATKLGKLELPLPPLAEQKRIAAQVESLLTRASAARERLAKVPSLLARLRQSVLAAACSGQLTADWRESEATDVDLPHGWDRVELDELLPKGGIFDGPFGSNLKTADYTESGVRVIRMGNIGHLDFNAEKETFISEEKYQTLTKHTVGEGDIIFASFISDEIRACVLPPLPTTAVAKADCFCIRPIDSIDRTYLSYQLANHQSYNELIGAIHGATRPRVNTTQLRRMPVRVCPLSEQQEIVRRVEALFELARQVERRVDRSRTAAASVVQSILRAAFRGELVETEAELARREGRDYEPASELLARILAERANSGQRRAK